MPSGNSKSRGPVKELKRFPAHSIVKIGGRWGVLCTNLGYEVIQQKTRIIDFWDGGRETVANDVLAEGLPE